MFDEEVGGLRKILDNGDVDLFVDTEDEDEVGSVAEMFNEAVGWLLKMLDKEDVDLFVDTDDEYENCCVA